MQRQLGGREVGVIISLPEEEYRALKLDAERYRWASKYLVLTGTMMYGEPVPIQSKAGWDACIDRILKRWRNRN